MHFKQKGIIITILIVVVLIIIVVFTMTNKKFDNPTTTTNNESSISNENAVSKTLYGAVQTPFPNFKITPEISSEDYPIVFKDGNKYGFKDKNGRIVIEAIYDKANDFWNGVASVRIDKDGQYIWKHIDIAGNVYDYDDVDGFFYGLAAVSKNGKYGFINTKWAVVVPLKYDELFCTYNDEEKARSAYAVKDGNLVYLNLKDGYEEKFEKYNPNKKSQYQRTIDMTDYDIVIANNMMIVDGVADPFGFKFPIYLLQGMSFDLYDQNKLFGTYKAELTSGSYEGMIDICFPDFDKNGNQYQIYYAILSDQNNNNNRDVKEIIEPEKFVNMAKQFLKDNKIENTSISIGSVIEGDFTGKGLTSVVLQIDDTYRGELNPSPIEENHTKNQFIDNKTAFVNAILLIEDINKPLDYKVIKSNIWTYPGFEYITNNIYAIANFDKDVPFELLIFNSYYEYGDYSIINLFKE